MVQQGFVLGNQKLEGVAVPPTLFFYLILMLLKITCKTPLTHVHEVNTPTKHLCWRFQVSFKLFCFNSKYWKLVFRTFPFMGMFD